MTKTLDDMRGEKILDSRDVIARFEELESERADLNSEIDDTNVEIETARQTLKEWDEENAEELRILKAFIDEGSSEWQYGETLILGDHFKEYAQDLAEDIGALENCSGWPATCIDWERAARELKMDYTEADLDGETYYFRE